MCYMLYVLYVRQYIDDVFVEFGQQPSIQLILINIDTCQYFFNIFQYFSLFIQYFSIFSILDAHTLAQ
jgi:hypothetical protein